LISKEDVQEAIAQVTEDNGNQITQSQTDALVNLIYKSADVENAGVIDRVQLKEAMIANSDKMNSIAEDILPQTNAVVAHVMDTLNSTNSGSIRKRDFKKALDSFNDNNHTELDVDSIVNDVFKNTTTLDRSIIRSKMNQNSVIQDTVAAEPI